MVLGTSMTVTIIVIVATSDLNSHLITLMTFLRILLPQVLPYITHIFNTILTTSKFPMAWKISKIVPIAKKKRTCYAL
jgi:hypothetical protein